MLGFSDLLKNYSATPVNPLLEPRLKVGHNAATAAPPPEIFDTPVGERRVPREKDPKKPNYEMIKDARKGVLSGFLRSGQILRASDFVKYVNPKTAAITLHNIYDYKTRCLAAIDNQPISRPPLSSMISFKKVADEEADEKKSLRNLFFITLARDELPSFHFWTKLGDLDPVTAGQPIDWGKHFEENPPSPATTAKIAMLESERKERAQRAAAEQQSTQNEQPLGFLDGYNDINLPGSGRELAQQQAADDVDSIPLTSAAPDVPQSPLDAEVLLQFNRGGMYLREFSHRALYATSRWLVENEEEDEEDEAKTGETEVRDVFLDILGAENDIREEKIVSVSRVSNRNFQDNIKPSFGRPETYFRVRSTRYESWWNLDSKFDSGGVGSMKCDLKLVRPNVGYCYCSARWHISESLQSNSQRFEKALLFLFDWESSAYPNSNHLSLDIPGYGSFDLHRDSEVLVDAEIQKIFAELSDAPVNPDSRPVEIFIRDVVEDVTEGSEFLGISSPRHDNNSKTETGPAAIPEELQAAEIRGGLGLPSVHPRLLTSSEISKLQERLRIAEATILETDDLQERLRTTEEELAEMKGLQERLKVSEDRAKLKSSCPFCPQDWAGATKQQQQDHLKLHQRDIVHQPTPRKCPQPHCKSWLGENQSESTYEAISGHLRLHIEEEHAEDGICERRNCHTNMYALTAEQQEEHESIHRENQETEEERDRLREQLLGLEGESKKPDRSQELDESLEDIVKERDQLQKQVRGLEDAARERDRLQQQVGRLQDVAKEMDELEQDLAYITGERDELQKQVQGLEDAGRERDRLQQQVRRLQDVAKEMDKLEQDLANITEERDSLQDRAVALQRQLKDSSGLDEGKQAKETEPENKVREDPQQPSQPEAPKKLRYCNICLKSVDKLSDNAKSKHADKCETSVSEFLLLTTAEAKVEREKRNSSGNVVKSQVQEGTERGAEVADTRDKRKHKLSAKAARSENQQDEAEDADTVQQPEASKAIGRRTAKRNFDTFKPPREDESDEEPESPRKKARLKGKGTKADKKETAPTRRSAGGAAGKDIYEPSGGEEEEHERDTEEVYHEPSSSAKGGKRKKKAAEGTFSKKTKTTK